MKLDFAREVTLKILYKIEEENGYSNLVLDECLEKEREKLNTRDINLISEIVYGTVTWKLSIDTILQKHSKIKLNKISKWIKTILRMGIYQIVFLDKIPKSAAVNESVNLCKKYGYKSTSFVNAILRKVEKSDYEELKKIENNFDRISKVYSMPKWIVERLINQYGIEKTEEICRNSNVKPRTTIRVNTLKITSKELEQKLEEKQIAYEQAQIPNFFYLKNVKNISNLDVFKEGLFTVQDEGAGEIGYMLSPKPGEKILDACSAPGGKTTHLAELMKNVGDIVAWDIHEHRVKLVEQNAQRLGISIIQAQTKDAIVYEEKFNERFDKILLDVPCMGLGVLKRKPDIKWQKTKEDMIEIREIQENLLKVSSNYLKPGGELVYSTCSILKEENEEVIEKIIKLQEVEKDRKNKLQIIETRNILPEQNTDGFFICKMRKNSVV